MAKCVVGINVQSYRFRYFFNLFLFFSTVAFCKGYFCNGFYLSTLHCQIHITDCCEQNNMKSWIKLQRELSIVTNICATASQTKKNKKYNTYLE